jgi:hypothetical protein
LLVIGCLTACDSPAATKPEARPSATTASSTKAGTTAEPEPSTPWDRLLAAGEPGDELTAARAGLPAAYLPDRGEDDYRKTRKQSVRRDVAAYLLRVRALDQPTADTLGWQLQAVPAAWCSLVLPGRTPADFDRQLTDANRRGQQLATLLKVTFTPPVGAREQKLLVRAREAAAGQFCPAQARTPGTPVSERVAEPARFPDGTGPVDILETALPEHYAPNSLGGGTPTIQAGDLRHAYVDILAGTARVQDRTWPIALSCDQAADLLRPAEVTEYAGRLRRGPGSDREMAAAATGFAADTFMLLERRRSCG